MSDHCKEDVVRVMTLKGFSATIIAERLGISKRHVHRLRVAAGVAKKAPPRITAEQLARAAALIDDGCSIKEASRTVGASPRCLEAKFPGRGWTQEQVREYARFMKQNTTRRTANG